MRQSLASLAIAVALSGMPELITLYNENKLCSAHLLRQQGRDPLNAMQPQVCSTPLSHLTRIGTSNPCSGPWLHILNVLHPKRIASGRAHIPSMLTTRASQDT